MKLFHPAILVLVLLASSFASYASPAVIGVLEQPPCSDTGGVAVRALFIREGGRWNALGSDQAPHGALALPMSWTIAFRGRRLGSLQTTNPGLPAGDWKLARQRLLRIADGQTVPAADNPDSMFQGWCGPLARRPLVAVAQENYDRRQGWQPCVSPHDLRARIFPSFRAAAGRADTCRGDGTSAAPWAYQSADLILTQCVGDEASRILVRVSLDRQRNHCDGPVANAWSSYMFLVAGDVVRLVGRDLTIVDFGDYDGDRTSEMLFWYSGYDRDGYMLLYNDLRDRADYLWSYH